MAGILLTNSEARADVVDVVNITVPSSCSLSTNSGLGETYNVSMTPGQYKNDIGDTTISVFCNANDTFAIYAIGYSNDTYGNTEMISNNTTTTGNIATGTAINGSTSAWAMKLSSVTGTYAPTIENGFGNFSSVPPTYTKVASIASAIAPITGISQLKATYAIYISPTQKEAVYTGKVKYTVVNPNNAPAPTTPQTAASSCIEYFPNGSGVVGTMGCQPLGDTDTTATLLASNFSRSGYGFAGWSDVNDYTTNPNAHFYGPSEDITFTAGQYTGSNDGLALYAIWIPSAGSLQDSSKVSQLCGTGSGSLTAATSGLKSLSSVSALTDQRDNETYAIAKLADGKCWMIENLRLEADNTRGAANQALAQDYGTSATYGNFGGLADAESNFSGSTTANSLYYSGTQSGTASINIGTTNYPGSRMPRYNNINTQSRASNPTSNSFTSGNTVGGMYSYGNYYTWAAAIADTTYYQNYYNGQADRSTTSICPSGWRLPSGTDPTMVGNYGALSVALGGPANGANANSSSSPTGVVMSKIFRSYPNNFIYSGSAMNASILSRGSYSYYWSSTPDSNNDSYRFSLDESNVYPGVNIGSKYFGYNIRCVVVSN